MNSFNNDGRRSMHTRQQLLDAYPEMQKRVQSGQLPYLEKQLRAQYWNFKNPWFARTYLLTAFVLIVSGFWIGLDFLLLCAPAGIALMGGILMDMSAKYQSAARQFLANAPHATSSRQFIASNADEIAKLHKLRQDGVLSENEFQTAKKKLVG